MTINEYMSKMEGAGLSSRSSKLPTIEAFMRRMPYILLNNRYTAKFSGGKFWPAYSDIIDYMICSISLPQTTIENETVYVGGAAAMIPNGFQQGQLDMVVYNTGPELLVFQKWMQATYDQAKRTYGYYDDIKGDLQVTQYTTDGNPVQVFTFTDCVIYTMGGLQFGYESQTNPQTFNVSLTYFGYTLSTSKRNFEQLFTAKTPVQAALASLAEQS